MISSHWTKRHDQQHSDLWFIFLKRHTKHIIVTLTSLIYDKFCLYIFVEQNLYLLLIVYRSARLCKLPYTYFYEHFIDDIREINHCFLLFIFQSPHHLFLYVYKPHKYTQHTHTNTHWISQSKYWQYCNINDILHRMICVVMLCIVITVVMRALYIYDVNKISERPCNYVLFLN